MLYQGTATANKAIVEKEGGPIYIRLGSSVILPLTKAGRRPKLKIQRRVQLCQGSWTSKTNQAFT